MPPRRVGLVGGMSWRSTALYYERLNLALERLGSRDHALYDGSWAEWGAYPDLKVEQG